MITHEVNVRTPIFQRIQEGQMSFLTVPSTLDVQAGDHAELYEVGPRGNRVYRYIERDSKGRFANRYEDQKPIKVKILHVLRGEHVPGLENDFCALSFEAAA